MLTLSASGPLHNPTHYITWGWASISVPNLVVIAIMVALFALAVLVPFPKGRHDDTGAE